MLLLDFVDDEGISCDVGIVGGDLVLVKSVGSLVFLLFWSGYYSFLFCGFV